MTETDKAYTAGIIDGEGCIRMQRTTLGLDVSVGNTDMELLNWLQTHWGGKIYPNRYKRLDNAKPFFHWRLCSKLAFVLLEAIEPYMVIKRKRAIKALELRDLHNKQNNYIPGYNAEMRQRRQQIFESLREMNQRGTGVN